MEDGKTCIRIHPCDKKNKGGCSQICNKVAISEEAEEEEEEKGKPYNCSCKSGFELAEDGISCTQGIYLSDILVSPNISECIF